MPKPGKSGSRRVVAKGSKNNLEKISDRQQVGKARLVLLLKDPAGKPIKSRTRIIVKAKDESFTENYEARGKPGQVTRFIFSLTPQDYFVKVICDDFKTYVQSVLVRPDQDTLYEFMLSLRDPAEKGKHKREIEDEEEEEEENDAERLKGHMEYFLQRRTYPNKTTADPSVAGRVVSERTTSDTFPSDAREKAIEQKKRMKSITSREAAGPIQTTGCNWLSFGPRNINGRIRAMAIHPANGNTLYAGSANGGIWVTHDEGQSWFPLMRDEGALEIGAVAVHLEDPSAPSGSTVIYAGTGEPTNWPGYRGIGVLKSIDSGTTWNLAGPMPPPGNDRFSVILIDAATVTSDPLSTTLYGGGTPGGLYKSVDGGNSWQLLLNKDIQGLAIDPTDHSVLYAAVAAEGIYRYDPSTDTWNGFNTGFPSSIPRLVLIVIGESTPHKMYSKLDETVYVYESGTSTWQSVGNHGNATYGYWNNVLAVDPQDSNIVYAGGLNLERSFDGGLTWQFIGGLHADQHALVFDSTNHLNVYAGNDGGVYRGIYSTPMDSGSWNKVSDGLVITQFNHLGGVSVGGGVEVIGGGTQDNGTNRTVGGLTWDYILEADGGYYVVDPHNPYIQYAETQNGNIYKSVDGGTTWSFTSFPGGPWVTPILLDPTSPIEPNRILFAGGNDQVFRTTNSASTWTASSPSLGGEVNSIAISPISSAILYAGTSGGKVWRSSDNGTTMANWTDITIGTVAGSSILPNRSVTDIVVHHTDPNTVFVTFGGFESMTPTAPGHVFRGTSVDGGISWRWENISANLPDIPVNAVQVNAVVSSIFYIGTDVGVFATNDDGISWQDFELGLPNVVITDLALNSTSDILRASTYGRGMFEIQLKSKCLDVDLYVRDNKLDTGETIPSPSNVLDPTLPGSTLHWWESADIKIDSHPYYPLDSLFDGIEFDLSIYEDVIRNDPSHPNPNRLYVQVHNRGPFPAHNVKVKVIWLDCAAATPELPADFWSNYPNDWTASSDWKSVDPSIPFQIIPELLPNTPKVLMWNWIVPTSASDHVCMVGIVSSDEDPVNRSDAIPDDRRSWVIVPNDKHITQRNLHVITLPFPSSGEVIKTIINLYNPFDFHQYFDIIIDKNSMPLGSKLTLLLPKVEMRNIQNKNIAIAKGINLSKNTRKQWWSGKVKGITRNDWEYSFTVEGDPTIHSKDEDIEIIPDIMIGPLDKIQATLIVSPPPKGEPGSAYRFVVMQRCKETIIGGSTFELRIPPTEVKGNIIAVRKRKAVHR